VRFGNEIITTDEEIQKAMPSFDYPFLVLHGDQDQLILLEGSQMLFDKSPSSDKTLNVYPQAFHELFEDPLADQIFQDIVNWLDARC